MTNFFGRWLEDSHDTESLCSDATVIVYEACITWEVNYGFLTCLPYQYYSTPCNALPHFFLNAVIASCLQHQFTTGAGIRYGILIERHYSFKEVFPLKQRYCIEWDSNNGN